MLILKDFNLPGSYNSGIVLTLGNFDGVHLGHRAIIEETKRIAREKNLPSALMTFEPHPVSVLKTDVPPFRITSFAQKAELVEQLGIALMLAIKFDQQFAGISAEDFVKNILLDKLKVRHIVIGHDCNFGKNRSGNAEYLQAAAAEYGFGFSQVSSQKGDDNIYSSSLIRNYIKQGEIEAAESLLGHPFEIRGTVIKGRQMGRDLGFPTANLPLQDYVRPKFGVYKTLVQTEPSGPWYKSIANIGIKPTIGAAEPLLEVHILDFNQDIYGRDISVSIGDFLREEMKFGSLPELKKQIKADIEKLES